MKRRELREHIFQLLFRVEFNGQDEMAEQVSLYVDDMKEEEIVEPKDETYIEEKYKKIVEKLPEIDELLAFVRSRAAEQLTAGGLPPNIEELLSGFRDRVQTLTPMERTVLQYYIDGCSLEEVAARAYISISTAKKHNTNINRKLGVTSREELMLYIDLFRRCGRLDEIAAPRAEDTARCTT